MLYVAVGLDFIPIVDALIFCVNLWKKLVLLDPMSGEKSLPSESGLPIGDNGAFSLM